MEHRYGQRSPAHAKVLIYQRGLPVAIGRLRDIGRHGFLVESEYTNVAINQPLEIELLLRNPLVEDHMRCKVVVMHKTGGGFGAAVDETCPASCAVLSLLEKRFRYRNITQIESVDPVESFARRAVR